MKKIGFSIGVMLAISVLTIAFFIPASEVLAYSKIDDSKTLRMISSSAITSDYSSKALKENVAVTKDVSKIDKSAGTSIVTTSMNALHVDTNAYVGPISSLPINVSQGSILRYDGSSWVTTGALEVFGYLVNINGIMDVDGTIHAGSSITTRGQFSINPDALSNPPSMGWTSAEGMNFANAEKYTFDNKVGINTSSPDATLRVNGTLKANYYIAYNGKYGITNSYKVKDSDGDNCVLSFTNGLLTDSSCTVFPGKLDSVK